MKYPALQNIFAWDSVVLFQGLLVLTALFIGTCKCCGCGIRHLSLCLPKTSALVCLSNRFNHDVPLMSVVHQGDEAKLG